jgi:hypothetical protein
MRRRYLVVLVLAVLALLLGTAGSWAYNSFVDTSAKDRIEADPPPALFPDATVAPLGHRLARVDTEAARLMRGWWADHDAAPHDDEFVAWLEQTLPGPPSADRRDKEVARVQKLAGDRTTAGETASTWLEGYGKKDVWKLMAHDQAELLSTSAGDDVKNTVDSVLSMTKTVADDLGARYQQSAPYVLHPELRTDHVVAPGDVCPCSYPSRHAAAGAAARTYLGRLAPAMVPDYRWWESEIDYSRLYMAGHVVSDLQGGVELGDMIGEYFARTRGDAAPEGAL